MQARCQCGSVTFTTPLPEPLALYICHCTECKRQSSSVFGTSAIYPRFDIPKSDSLSCYVRKNASGVDLHCHFCRNCGTRLIHEMPTTEFITVKGGCIEGLNWSKAIHLYTKNAMVPIPEGSETHSEGSSSDYGRAHEMLD